MLCGNWFCLLCDTFQYSHYTEDSRSFLFETDYGLKLLLLIAWTYHYIVVFVLLLHAISWGHRERFIIIKGKYIYWILISSRNYTAINSFFHLPVIFTTLWFSDFWYLNNLIIFIASLSLCSHIIEFAVIIES